MLPASGVQLARHHVQQHRGGRVDLRLGDLPGAAQRRSPSSNSPIQIAQKATAPSAGASIGRSSKP